MAVVAKTPPADIREIVCSGCGWTLEYRPKDMVLDPDFDDDVGHGARPTHVKCPRPRCGHYTRVTPRWPNEDYDL